MKCNLYLLIGLLFFGMFQLDSQTLRTPPTPSGNNTPIMAHDLDWPNWWSQSTVAHVEARFNAGRRNEESLRGLDSGTLGYLNLPTDFLSRDFKEQALILINEERKVRHNVAYPGLWTSTGLELEGIEYDLSVVAQGHANDMQINDFFSHTDPMGNLPDQGLRLLFQDVMVLGVKTFPGTQYLILMGLYSLFL